MKGPRPSISDLLARLTQLEERTAKAEERAARAEARVSQLDNGNGHAMAVRNDPISRRSMLTKAAAVGAAGVAGALLLNRPKDVFASFTWTGGAANAADFTTTVTANAGFGSTGNAVLRLDANQGANPTGAIDGLQTTGSGTFSGIAAYGGNTAGTAYYGVGGAATGAGVAGPGLRVFQGTHNPGGGSANGGDAAAWIQANGASDGTGRGSGLNTFGSGSFGYGTWSLGALGTGTSPAAINGGPGMYVYSGPNSFGAQIIGDPYGRNTAIASHGVYGGGNALGVGGWFSGGRAQVQLVPNSGTGAPTTGAHFTGDLYVDAHEVIWVCIGNGTPGTFAPLQPGGMNNALFTAVSTQQYTFTGSDGATWVDMDPTNLMLTITPKYNCQAIFTASADLWTGTVGYNQDIGVSISGGAFPTTAGQPEGWKESSGAAAFSPNAAHLDVIVPLAQGTAYTIKLVWKSNKPAAGKLIAAGAGPIGGKFSPSRLVAWLVPTNPGGTLPRIPAQPYKLPVEVLAEPVLEAPRKPLS